MTLSPEFLIEGILSSCEVHLLGGPSGSGKTTWLFQELNDNWHEGGEILGRIVHPVPYLYIAADRSRKSVHQTMRRAGVDPANIPSLFLTGAVTSAASPVPGVIKEYLEKHPETKFFIIDGVMRLLPRRGDRFTDGGYSHISNFLATLNQLCLERDITILLIVHSPKQHEDSRYANPRERVMGSTAWACYTETVILVEPSLPITKETMSNRTLICLARNAAAEFREMEFNSEGRLVTRIEELDDIITVHFLAKITDGDSFTTDDFVKALGSHMSRATAMRRLKDLEAKGRIEKIAHGQWRKNRPN